MNSLTPIVVSGCCRLDRFSKKSLCRSKRNPYVSRALTESAMKSHLRLSLMILSVCAALAMQTAKCELGQVHKTVHREDAPRTAVSPEVAVKRNENSVLFSDSGKPILQYQAKSKAKKGKRRRANYVHPLYDLDGNVLTEDFPDDHLHHRGIFWAWHQVNVGERRAGDGWMATDFDWVVGEKAISVLDSGAAKMTANIQWKSANITDNDGKQLPIIHETTSIVVHPAASDHQTIDFEIKLLAAQPDVTIGGSEDVKGYGGFSVRIVHPKDIEFLTSQGKVVAIKTQLECGYWVDLVGTYFPKGKSDPGKPCRNSKSGVAILVHPSSAGYPNKWILRSKKSMQKSVFPGEKPVAVSQTKSTVLRYRLVIHKTEWSVDVLNQLSNDFAAIKFEDRLERTQGK